MVPDRAQYFVGSWIFEHPTIYGMTKTRRATEGTTSLGDSAHKEPSPIDPVDIARDRWVEHDWPGSASRMAAASSLQRAARVTGLSLDKALRATDLTQSRFELLAALAFSRTGAVPWGTLSGRLVVHVTSVTSLVDRLELQGYVKRRPHPTDRRGVLAEITPKGRRVIERAAEAVAEIDFGLGALTVEESNELRVLLSKLLAAANDR